MKSDGSAKPGAQTQPDLRVLIDADCLIAGTLTKDGMTTEILERWRDGDFEIVVCPHLLEEVGKSLRHPRMAGKYSLSIEEVDGFIAELLEEGLSVANPTSPPRIVAEDEGDDYLVALAIETDSSALVTRDRHFEKVAVAGLKILGPGEFLGLIRE